MVKQKTSVTMADFAEVAICKLHVVAVSCKLWGIALRGRLHLGLVNSLLTTSNCLHLPQKLLDDVLVYIREGMLAGLLRLERYNSIRYPRYN